jgi:branched-chain amino acid aminotransferase
MSKLDENLYTNLAKGLIVDVFDDVTKPVNTLANHKTCNSLVYVMAGIYRKENNLDEVFILNHNGFLCEAMSANIFVVFKKKIYTPALSEGCISGVMRTVVMQLANEGKMEVIEAQINPDILNEAEEVFLTNASRGIQWVMGFNSKRYFNKVSKELLSRLNQTI